MTDKEYIEFLENKLDNAYNREKEYQRLLSNYKYNIK
jgi:hypothetical protein